jgi:methionyl-tRNA formyltransferase
MRKFLFIGNRKFVLEKLLERETDVHIVCIGGTHLERDPFLKKHPHTIVESERETIELIQRGDYDILISNGLPYILDLQDLPRREYINIHPSYLPDLRGIDPVLGAIIYKRDAGATCHKIDSGIDTGDIISQVKIPFSEDLGASLLYQLSFFAEQEAFELAHARDFKVDKRQEENSDAIYFSRTPRTRSLDFNNSTDMLIQTVKAFDNKNQGASFTVSGLALVCYSAWLSTNPYLTKIFECSALNTIVMAYEDTIVIKRLEGYLFLSKINSPLGELIGKKIC